MRIGVSARLAETAAANLGDKDAHDIHSYFKDRYDAGSLLITSQVPVDRWYDIIGIPTLADAVLDRVVHNAYRIELSGESLRKRKAPDKAA